MPVVRALVALERLPREPEHQAEHDDQCEIKQAGAGETAQLDSPRGLFGDSSTSDFLLSDGPASTGSPKRAAPARRAALDRSASTATPGTHASRSPAKTSGHASRSSRGTRASTKMSCSLRDPGPPRGRMRRPGPPEAQPQVEPCLQVRCACIVAARARRDLEPRVGAPSRCRLRQTPRSPWVPHDTKAQAPRKVDSAAATPGRVPAEASQRGARATARAARHPHARRAASCSSAATGSRHRGHSRNAVSTPSRQSLALPSWRSTSWTRRGPQRRAVETRARCPAGRAPAPAGSRAARARARIGVRRSRDPRAPRSRGGRGTSTTSRRQTESSGRTKTPAPRRHAAQAGEPASSHAGAAPRLRRGRPPCAPSATTSRARLGAARARGTRSAARARRPGPSPRGMARPRRSVTSSTPRLAHRPRDVLGDGVRAGSQARGRNGRRPRRCPARAAATSSAVESGPPETATRTRSPGRDRSRIAGWPSSGSSGMSCAAWWCRLDSNQRQRDYESRALPPELRHRGSRARTQAPSEEKILSCGLCPRLQLALLGAALRQRHPLPLVHSLSRMMTEPRRGSAPRLGADWLRRSDSNRRPSGYEPDELPLLHSAPEVYRRPSRPPGRPQWCGEAVGDGDGGGVGEGDGAAVTRYRRSCGFGVAVEPRLLLIGGAGRDGLDVLAGSPGSGRRARAFWWRRSATCWLSLWPMYASCAKAYGGPDQRDAGRPPSRLRGARRTRCVRTVPEATMTLLYLMLRRGSGRPPETGADYNKRPPV